MEQLLDWKKVEPPAKGVGKNMGNKVPHMPGGKSGKSQEEGNMWFTVPDEEIKETKEKFIQLRNKYPDLIEAVSEDSLRKVAKYLADPYLGAVEKDVWEKIAEGHIYSYSCYVHETAEIEQRVEGASKKEYHGEALFQQYSLLRKYIQHEISKEFDVILLCCADSWRIDTSGKIRKDYSNAKKLRDYLKIRKEKWYNREEDIPTFDEWSDVSVELREIMSSLRQCGKMP